MKNSKFSFRSGIFNVFVATLPLFQAELEKKNYYHYFYFFCIAVVWVSMRPPLGEYHDFFFSFLATKKEGKNKNNAPNKSLYIFAFRNIVILCFAQNV